MCSILVVDDDPTLCDLFESILSDEGHEVRCAQNGTDALAAASAQQPGLIITDLRLPRGGGAAFVKSYRRLPGAKARIIVVSGVTTQEYDRAHIDADAFLQKPFELEALLSAISGAIPAGEGSTDPLERSGAANPAS